MSMTRAEHHRRAQELLAPIAERTRYAVKVDQRADLTEEERDVLAVAQVHATLAAAPDLDYVARLEATAGDLVGRLRAALAELEADTSSESGETARSAATFIRERVLGEGQ